MYGNFSITSTNILQSEFKSEKFKMKLVDARVSISKLNGRKKQTV